MGRNSDLKRNVENFRRRLYRSSNGKLLGVFSGIAESLGFCVRWTRIVGVIVLFSLAGTLGANGLWISLMVGGFFYMLMALLMQPPRQPGSYPRETDDDDSLIPPPVPPSRWNQPVDSPYQSAPAVGRVDLAQIDRQLESLNRRIQRMETIVTDRQYDWERRLDS